MTRSIPFLAAALLLAAITPASAHEVPGPDETVDWVTPSRWRLEIALGAHVWPSLGALEPQWGGKFDDAGFDLNFAWHWPVTRFANGELLVGADIGLFSSDSNIGFIYGDLTARGAYLTPSLKWMFGRRHRYSLDAGLGYYSVDFAEVVGGFPDYYETQVWERSSAGGYLGATVDFGGAFEERRSGLMLALKVHFFDLGSVRDDDPFLPPVLGPGAGDLGGPVYSLLVGYRWR
jgi:hypothetical protein